MRGYIDDKKDWGRCYRNDAKSNDLFNWNLDSEHPRNINRVMDIVNPKKPLYEVLLPKLTLSNNWTITYYISSPRTSELEIQFNDLAAKWKAETGLFSLDRDKVNDTFLDIISLGKDIVPFILGDMQKPEGTARWHIALKALTKENPISNEELSKSKLVKEKWIRWGKEKNII